MKSTNIIAYIIQKNKGICLYFNKQISNPAALRTAPGRKGIKQSTLSRISVTYAKWRRFSRAIAFLSECKRYFSSIEL